MELYETDSSSLCGCYLCEAGMDCRAVQPSPFYPSTGQPFVYFCDVPDNGKQNKRPNFFMRAFRWYTDDLQPKKEKSPDTPNVGAFATWLDAKYEQFLQENDAEPCCIKPTQTSFEDSCGERICPPPCTPETQASDTCSPCCTKKRKFGRMKSPRKKRRDKSKSTERKSADDIDKQHSMEFILPPKDISRAASDCCRAPTQCDSDRQRLVAKSQSLTSITVTKDGKVVEEYTKSVIFDNPPMEQKSNKSVHSTATRTLKRDKVAFNDASCQCSVSSDDAETQYEISKTTFVLAKDTTRSPKECPSCCSSRPSSTETKTKDKKKKKKRDTSKKRSKKDLKESKKDSKESRRSKDSQSLLSDKGCHRSASKSKSDVSCQCYTSEKADAEVQCLSENKDPTTCIKVGESTIIGTKICTQSSQNQPPTSQQNVIITTPFVTQEPVGKCSADCGYFAKKLVAQRSTQCRPTCAPLQHTEAQTSDLTINIDPNAIHGYPLFMKIVCSDRLTDDRVFVVK